MCSCRRDKTYQKKIINKMCLPLNPGIVGSSPTYGRRRANFYFSFIRRAYIHTHVIKYTCNNHSIHFTCYICTWPIN